jgi:DNA-binding LacI/PurR family transcriptional regulator
VSKRTPSIIDVARAAGVSHQTVSRVINNKPNVKESTRLKVESVMEDIGFRPNSAARALVTGQSSIVGVLSHDTTLFGPASVLHAVQSAAREIGYAVTLISLKSIYPVAVIAGLEEFANLGAEGVVIIAPQSAEYEVLRTIPGNLPAVIIEGEEVTSIPSVEVDQLQGAVLATQHLIELGHKNIAHISGPSEWFAAQRRKAGWQQALHQAKLKAEICLEGDWSPKSGYLATKEILKDKSVTAIFSANDDMALGAYRAINELGFSIPDRISLVGFDDVPASAFLSPGLTSIRQDFDQVGHVALGLLMKMIRGERPRARKILVAPELIERQSTTRRAKK